MTQKRPPIDKAAYQKRLDRISEIFADMVGRADDLSRERCPYRDRLDRCTAEFRCRNQAAPDAGEELARCTHDGRFDYRTAWESNPNSYKRAKEKLKAVKRTSEERRAATRRRKRPD